MKSENKICQNCKKEFTIEPDDFNFYEKIKVPAPTWCPECRMFRRWTWRNERNLSRRNCGLCGKNTLSIFRLGTDLKVFCQSCWWGDGWDPYDSGKIYDFDKDFFTQFQELMFSTPLCGLFNLSYVNSDYCNYTYQSKNCYLNFASDMNEDTAYLYHSIENRKSYDLLGSRKNENCYELLDCEKCYESENLVLSEECINCSFCYDCRSCHNCIGCFGLRSKKYNILNKQYSEEEYKNILKKLRLGIYQDRKEFIEKYNELLIKYPRKFSSSRHVVNSTGDYLKHVKSCKKCFDIEGPAEYLKYCAYGVTNMKDTLDNYAFGVNVENCYEMLGAGDNVQRVMMSMYVFFGSYDCNYSLLLNGCSNCFGCIGLRNKSYCILNKQYTKEEYEELIPKIIKHMNDMPYIDSKGIVYKYGEFFPPELSPFCYNETIAQEYFPLTKEQAIKEGYKWKDKEERNYKIDIYNSDIPDDIKDVDESIINKVIECEHKDCNHQCTEAFKIIPDELAFYKKMNLPLPRLCPNCRHYARLSQRNPLKLWHRKCMKESCTNEFETSYAPERPEIVYCESCYNKEVY